MIEKRRMRLGRKQNHAWFVVSACCQERIKVPCCNLKTQDRTGLSNIVPHLTQERDLLNSLKYHICFLRGSQHD